MGKKDKADDEGYEFIPEDFDEDGFIHKEMVSFRTTVVLFLVGIVAALTSWALFAAQDGARSAWFLGLLILAVAFYSLRFVYKALKIDIAHYQRREWLGTAFLLFFTWLGFLMLFINPPMSDFAAPIGEVYVQPGAPEAGSDVDFELHFADNHRLDGAVFMVMDEAGTVIHNETIAVGGKNGAHDAMLDGLTAGTYTYTLSTDDSRGLRTTTSDTFTVVQDALQVSVGDLTDPQGTIFVQAASGLNLYAIYLDLDGSEDHVYLEFDEALGGWRATANFKGWQAGSNTFHVIAEERNHFFQGTTLVRGGTLTDGPYTVEVSNPGDYDKGRPKRANPVDAPVRSVPGFEVPLLIAGLVGIAVVARRK